MLGSQERMSGFRRVLITRTVPERRERPGPGGGSDSRGLEVRGTIAVRFLPLTVATFVSAIAVAATRGRRRTRVRERLGQSAAVALTPLSHPRAESTWTALTAGFLACGLASAMTSTVVDNVALTEAARQRAGITAVLVMATKQAGIAVAVAAPGCCLGRCLAPPTIRYGPAGVRVGVASGGLCGWRSPPLFVVGIQNDGLEPFDPAGLVQSVLVDGEPFGKIAKAWKRSRDVDVPLRHLAGFEDPE